MGGGGQQQGPAWQFSSANSVKGMGEQALNAHTVRSSQPASVAGTEQQWIMLIEEFKALRVTTYHIADRLRDWRE